MTTFRFCLWKSVFGCVLISVFILSACAPVQPAASTAEKAAASTEEASEATVGEQELEHVNVVILPFMSFAPFYIAQEEGFFIDEGLDVEFINMFQQDAIIAGMLAGEIDIASGLINAGTINTIARGGPIKIVADKGYIDPDACGPFAIVARESLVDELDVNDPATFSGLIVNVPPSSWIDYYFDKALGEIGMAASDFEYISVQSPAQLEALAQGQLDLSVNNEPWITRFLEAGHQQILAPVTELMPNGQSAVVFYGESMLGDRSDVGKAFMTAYLRGVRQYNEGATDRNLEIISVGINLEPDLLTRICWPAIRNSGEIDVQDILNFQDWAMEVGYVESPVTEEEFWDPQFVEYANEVLGPAE